MGLAHRLTAFAFGMVILSGGFSFSDERNSGVSVVSFKKQAEDALLARTAGGRQFWGDVHHFRGWRIQQNVFTKQYRLVDPEVACQLSGSFDACQVELKKIRNEKKLVPESGAAVVMIHGLLQTSKCMREMGANLRDSGYSTIDFDYPSTQVSIPEAAGFLNQLIKSLEGFEEINFVVHSMGGLVVRAYAMEFEDPRIKRMVMLGTPNQGAEMADITQKVWILRTASGPSARQLRTRSDGLISKLPIPKFEFGVIAGSRGTTTGWNPLIPGDDDGTVTVASTKLPGAADFTTVRAVHSRLLWDDVAIAHTLSFLKDGRFLAESELQPILTDGKSKDVDSAQEQIPKVSNPQN